MNMGSWGLTRQGFGRKPSVKQGESVDCRGVVESNFIVIGIFYIFWGVLVLMDLELNL